MEYKDRHVRDLHNLTVSYARNLYSNYILGIAGSIISDREELRNALYMGFTYMRWLDNIADEFDAPMKEKIKMLKNQLLFLQECRRREFNKVELYRLRIEERCAYFFMKDIKSALLARGAPPENVEAYMDSYLLMIESILQDTANQGRLMDAKEFYEQVYWLKAGVLFGASAYMLKNDPSDKLLRACKYFGYIWQVNNDNLDIQEDLQNGLINITREEVEKNNIDLERFAPTYDGIVEYLAGTDFFDDRAKLLQKWRKYVEDGIDELSLTYRILIRNYLDRACPESFSPGDLHFETLRRIDEIESRRVSYFAWLFLLLLPESVVLKILKMKNIANLIGTVSPNKMFGQIYNRYLTLKQRANRVILPRIRQFF